MKSLLSAITLYGYPGQPKSCCTWLHWIKRCCCLCMDLHHTASAWWPEHANIVSL